VTSGLRNSLSKTNNKGMANNTAIITGELLKEAKALPKV
jgi:hypothetical protein